jgi:hypothetical protein
MKIKKIPTVPQDVFFQKTQFDKDLRMSHRPIGTTHIPNQGSNTLDEEDIGLPFDREEDDEEPEEKNE